MNSSESNDQRSRSSSNSSQVSNTSRCSQATPAQFRHQTQGVIIPGHQGHQQQTLQTLQNNHSQQEQTNHPACESEVNSSSSSSTTTTHAQVAVATSNTPQTGWPSQSLVNQTDCSPPNHKSTFPTSKSCNAISSSSGSNSITNSSSSCSSPSSSLSSSASASLTSLVLQQQQQQQTQAKYINVAQITHSQSVLASAKSSVHASTPSVSLSSTPSQLVNQQPFQPFLSSPSLVHSPYPSNTISNSVSNTINSINTAASFVNSNSNSATGYSSVAGTICTTGNNSSHHTHQKQLNSQVYFNMEANPSSQGSAMLSQSSENNSQLSGGSRISHPDANAGSRNLLDSTVCMGFNLMT